MNKQESEIRRLREENDKLQDELKRMRQPAATLPIFDAKLLDKAPTGVIIVNHQNEIEYYNKGFAEILGLGSENLIGEDFRKRLNEEKSQILTQKVYKRMTGQFLPDHFEMYLKRISDGEERLVEFSTSQINNLDGTHRVIAQVTDITDTRDSQIAIRHSQAFLKNLFDSIQDGIIVIDKNHNIILANRWMEEKFNQGDTLKQKKCYGVFKQRTEACENCPGNRTFETGIPSKKEMELILNGDRIWLEYSSYPVVDEKNQIVNVIEYVKDITENKRYREELEEKEMFISGIANTSPAIIHVFDLKKGRHIYINQAIESLLGYSMKEILKHDLFSAKGILHPEDLSKINDLFKKMYKSELDTIEEIGYRVKHKNGNYLNFRSFIRPFHREENGRVSELIGISVDITDQEIILQNLKNTTNKLSNIMLAANDGMWEWFLDTGRIIFDNRFFEMSGYDINEFPHHFAELQKRVHPEDLEKVLKEVRLHLEGKTKRYSTEYRFMRKDESWMWILGRGIIVERNSEGEPIRMIGTHTDISELKKVQKELHLAKNKAEESDKLKSAFLANMSHEIRTPMNGILGFAELLSEEDLSKEEIKEYVSIIKRSGNRMLTTINDIIDISKIESGMIDAVYGEIDVINQLEYLHNFFIPEATKKGISLILDTGSYDRPVRMITDLSKFNAILTNLIKNALKFTQRGEIIIGFIKKENAFEFYVKDTGIGIDDDKIEAIFSRFVQADLTITKPYEGSGLGLSISKAYVELLGGKIWAESAIDTGSTFHFTLPHNEEPSGGLQQGIIIPEEHQELITNCTLLIVDDEENILYLLNELFKTKCTHILTAKNGIEAVKLCKKNPEIDIILMDIKMPEMDGYEASRQIRQFNKDVIIIGQTAFALSGDREKVLEAGCNDYVSKPINRKELFEKIYKLLADSDKSSISK